LAFGYENLAKKTEKEGVLLETGVVVHGAAVFGRCPSVW
jgi:hypothetical protein